MPSQRIRMDKSPIILRKSWVPDRPISKGARSYHNAVINASWNKDNLYELVSIIKPEICENDIVVDFGAGTGASAVYILEHLKTKINLCLVDNSPAWLAQGYELLNNNHNVSFFILEKKENGYVTLDKTIGNSVADMVVSANTFHLVPDLNEAFSGVARALKKEGIFVFQSGNILRKGRPDGVLMIDDTIHRVHDIALEIINNNPLFEMYRAGLNERIKLEEPQRRFIFPFPRPIEAYFSALKKSGFSYEEPIYKEIKVKYSDWMNFLRVRRLQAGILPEIGSANPSQKEEQDRDTTITIAANQLFHELEKKNPFADNECFTVEWSYVKSIKKS